MIPSLALGPNLIKDASARERRNDILSHSSHVYWKPAVSKIRARLLDVVLFSH